MESGSPQGTFALELTELRTLANSLPGEKPELIRVEEVLEFEFPNTAIVAGSGWSFGITDEQLADPSRA